MLKVMVEKCGLMTLEEKQCWEYHWALPEDSISQVLYFDVEMREDLDSIKYRICELYKNNPSLRLSFYKNNDILYQCINFYDLTRNYYYYINLQTFKDKGMIIHNYILDTEKNMNIRKTKELTKFVIFQVDKDIFRCVFLLHHIICDEWSIHLLRNQFLYGFNDDGYSYDIIDYALKQRDYESYVMHDIKEYYDNLYKDLKISFSYYVPLLNQRQFDLCNFENNIKQGKTTIYRTSLGFHVQNSTSLMAIIYTAYFLIGKWFYNKNSMLIASPVRNTVGKNKKLIGYLNSGIYTYIEWKYEVYDLNSLLLKIYLNLVNAMKFSVPDHAFLKLDGRFLRRMTMLYINIMPRSYDVMIDESNYKESFVKEDSYPFYPLSIFVIEKDANIFFEYSFSNEFYTNADIISIHKNFHSVMLKINELALGDVVCK